jgi:hypothetical protein
VQLNLPMHVLVLAALVVNLWVGGDLIEVWAGHLARVAFEALLILGYLVFVLRMGELLGPRDRE